MVLPYVIINTALMVRIAFASRLLDRHQPCRRHPPPRSRFLKNDLIRKEKSLTSEPESSNPYSVSKEHEFAL